MARTKKLLSLTNYLVYVGKLTSAFFDNFSFPLGYLD